MPPRAFAFNSRYVLLTYAQSAGLDEWRVLDHISTLGGECIIARENHEDGGTHLHVFVDFGWKFRSRKTDVFDVDGRHPNVSASRGTPEKGYDYTIKDGDVVAGGLGRPVRTGGDSKTYSNWAEIESATSREQFWELLASLDPKSMLTHFTTLGKYADWKFTPHPPCYESPRGIEFDGDGMEQLNDWLSQSGIGLGNTHLGTFSRPTKGDPVTGPHHPTQASGDPRRDIPPFGLQVLI